MIHTTNEKRTLDNILKAFDDYIRDGGMDFDAYMRWANSHSDHSHVETIETLAEHWAEIQAMKQAETPEDGGMTLA